MNIKHSFTYDDVLLVPKYSEVESRADIDLSVDLGKDVQLSIPIVSANMKDVTESKMAQTIALLGGLGIIHRFMPVEEQADQYALAVQGFEDLRNRIGCSVGVKDVDYDALDLLIGKFGCKIICVDVAHGHHENCGLMTKYVDEHYPDVLLISGNVATADGAKYLSDMGADVIKVGIGSGSLCTTRIETGNGVPSITALEEIKNWMSISGRNVKIIADGGIRKAGDVVKSLCFADAVMLGNLLAGTDEAPGTAVTINNIRYKQYNGSSTLKPQHIEGVQGYVAARGPTKDIVEKLLQGVRSGLSYQGCNNLDELKQDPEFVAISNSGLVENYPHDVVIR